MKQLTILASLLFLLTGCSSHQLLKKQDRYIEEYHQGKELSFPKLSYKNQVWQLLDQGLIYFTQKKDQKAKKAFLEAMEKNELFRKKIIQDTLKEAARGANYRPYQAPLFEESLLYLYLFFVLDYQEDNTNQYAMLRKIEELYQKTGIKNGLGSYLFQLYLRQENELSNADIIYQRVAKSNRSLTQLPKNANCLIIHHTGRSPKRVARKIIPQAPFSVAIQQEISLKNLSLSLNKGIQMPVLEFYKKNQYQPTITIDHKKPLCKGILSIEKLAKKTLEQTKTADFIQGAIRLATEEAIIRETKKKDEPVSVLVDMLFFLQHTEPLVETRSWRSLPGQIDFYPLQLKQGLHTITIQQQEIKPQTHSFLIKEDELCIIHLFSKKGYPFSLIIPKRFQKEL